MEFRPLKEIYLILKSPMAQVQIFLKNKTNDSIPCSYNKGSEAEDYIINYYKENYGIDITQKN